MLELGKKAPDFELPDQNGEMHKLSDYAGKKVILYFYPKDNTPGCTKQACGFSERYPQFTEKGAVILGVSKDSVASHKRFEEKYGLAFTLLADPERKVIEAYDVWKEKKNYGKVSMGKPVYGMLGTTFGGNHLACAAAIAVLEIMEDEKLIDNAREVGAYLLDELHKLPGIKEIRGRGLMIGIEFEESIKKVRSKLLFEEKVFTGVAGTNTIRLLPPLCLSMDEAKEFIVRFRKVLNA